MKGIAYSSRWIGMLYGWWMLAGLVDWWIGVLVGVGSECIMVGGCWQERRGGTASGLSCCQLNTALIDDEGDSDGDEDRHMLMGRG